MENKKQTRKTLHEGESPRHAMHIFRLYVSGPAPRSLQAILNLRQICEQYLKNDYEIEVVDIFQQPELAKNAGLIATPTLIKKLPEPIRRVIGDLNATKEVLVALDIREMGSEEPQNED